MGAVKTADVRAAGLHAGRAPSILQALKAGLARMGWASRAGLLGLLASAGLLVCLAAGFPVWWGLALGGGVAAVALLSASSPEAVKVAGVLVGYLPFAAALGFTYTSLAWGISPVLGDAAGGGLALMSMLVALSVLGMRLSPGAPWVTAVWIALASTLPGLALAYTFPTLGVWAAWLPMLATALTRYGLWSRCAGLVLSRREFSPRGNVPGVLDVEGALSVRLVKVPDGYVTVSPAGVCGVVVVSATGPAVETRQKGLTVPGVASVELEALKAVRSARAAARLSGTPRQHVPALLVLTGRANANVDRWMGVHVRDEGGVAAAVRVVGEGALASVLSGSWKPRRVRRVATLVSTRVRRHRIR